jgi:hypothetical protein
MGGHDRARGLPAAGSRRRGRCQRRAGARRAARRARDARAGAVLREKALGWRSARASASARCRASTRGVRRAAGSWWPRAGRRSPDPPGSCPRPGTSTSESLEDRFYPTEPLMASLARRTYAVPFEFVTEAQWIRSALQEEEAPPPCTSPGLHERFLEPVEPLHPGGTTPSPDRRPLGIPSSGCGRPAVEGLTSRPGSSRGRRGGAMAATGSGLPEGAVRVDAAIYASCDVLTEALQRGGASARAGDGPGVPVTSDVTGHDGSWWTASTDRRPRRALADRARDIVALDRDRGSWPDSAGVR